MVYQPDKLYIYLTNYCKADVAGVAAVDKENFDCLEPWRKALGRAEPAPKPIGRLVWEEIADRAEYELPLNSHEMFRGPNVIWVGA